MRVSDNTNFGLVRGDDKPDERANEETPDRIRDVEEAEYAVGQSALRLESGTLITQYSAKEYITTSSARGNNSSYLFIYFKLVEGATDSNRTFPSCPI
jgi:hypothetical protein